MILLLFIPLFLLLGFSAIFKLDPDFGWHLFLGQKMVESGELIERAVGYNVFKDTPMIDHEWLSDIILYRLQDKFGMWPLAILTILGTILLGFLMIKIIAKQNAENHSAIISLSCLIMALSYVYGGIRPQYLLVLASACLIYIFYFIGNTKIRFLLNLLS